ncbi:hypothetical protein SAMN03159382_06090, partial [Pseudomonas sp. NFACC23-1]
RFNSPDSWSPFGPGIINSYAYCLGDPINRRDNNGHISTRLITAIPFKPLKNFLLIRKIRSLEESAEKMLFTNKNKQLKNILINGIANSEYSKRQKSRTLEQLSQSVILKHNLPQTNLPLPIQRELELLKREPEPELIQGSPQWVEDRVGKLQQVANREKPSTQWNEDFEQIMENDGRTWINARVLSTFKDNDISSIRNALNGPEVFNAEYMKLILKIQRLRRSL